MLDITIHRKQDEYKQNKKTHTTQYVLDITMHRKQDEYKQNKKKHTTQYVLDITIHRKQGEYKQNKKKPHNTICVGHHYTQETRGIQTK